MTYDLRPTSSELRAKILEVFHSIQGEGKYAGVPQVFVRFFECHMHCSWCDTPDSIGDGKREYKEYSVSELFDLIKPLIPDCHSVSLTGGEPLLQADFIKELIPYLRKTGLSVYLETSGVLHKELKKIIDDVDIVSMDFKLPSSTKCRSFWKEHEEFLKIAHQRDCFIKAVITADTNFEDIRKSIELIKRIDPQLLFILQPNYFEMTNGVVAKCREFQNDCLKHIPNVRILPQLHKFMKLR